MIWELWQSLTAPCDPIARKLGYLYESIAIKARAKRCGAAWYPHLQHTRQFILARAQKCREKRIAVILGSGWLLDVPLRELSRDFEEVHLIDIFHPREVIRQAKQLRNVKIFTDDISGVASQVNDLVERAHKTRAKQPLPTPKTLKLSQPSRTDFIASVNVLSQLTLRLTEVLQSLKNSFGTALYHESEISEFAASIQEHHLNFLQQYKHACIVSDVESHTLHRSKRIRTDSLVAATKKLVPDEEWMWDIAPHGEIAPHEQTRHRVVACDLSRRVS